MTAGRFIRGTISLVLIIMIFMIILLILSIAFITPVYHITSNTMLPTINNGDVIIVYRGFKDNTEKIEYKKGDICLVQDESKLLVRRIIAGPGDTVFIDKNSGKINVSGEILEERYLNNAKTELGSMEFPVVVPENEYFVLGDNREHVTDSRMQEFGCINKRDMRGFVIAKIYPLNQAKIFSLDNAWNNFIN
jgi:signal peptidase I